MVVRGDADGAGGLVAQLAQRGHFRLDLVKAWPRGAQQALPRLGRRDAAGGAGQQPQAKPFLKSTHGVAQGRLRNTKLRRRLGEAALLRDREEGEKIVEVFARHS